MPIEQLTVTRRERGKGWNSKSDGFQVAACSTNVSDDARTFLYERCMQLGGAVHPSSGVKALSSTHKQLDEWYSSAEKSDPEEMHRLQENALGAFPVFYDYVELPGTDLCVLSEIRYKGYRYQGKRWRPGIFFAHSFLFPPEALEPFGYNPMTAARHLSFLSDDDGNTQLPSLDALGAESHGTQDFKLLTGKPYVGHIDGLTEALIEASDNHKPIKLYVPDFSSTPELLEGLLNLLPPTARRRCTFCTFVDDKKQEIRPHVQGNNRQGGSEGRPPTTMLSFVYSPSGDTSVTVPQGNYRGDARTTVFNFTEDRFSELSATHPYARFAADSVAGNQSRLRHHHVVVEALGVGDSTKAWDSLLPAAALPDPKTEAEAVRSGIEAAAGYAEEPEKADVLLGWILPHVSALAQAEDANGLAQLCKAAPAVVDRASSATDPASYPAYVTEIMRATARALSEGKGLCPQALLNLAASARERLLLDLLTKLVPDADCSLSLSSQSSEATAFLDVLLDGVKAAWPNEEHRELLACLLPAIFRTASAAKLEDRAWDGTASEILKPFFRAEWKEDDTRLADALVTLDARIERLKRQRAIVEQLGVDRKSASWDDLEPAADLLAGAPDAKALRAGVEAVAKQSPVAAAQAEMLLGWIRPHARRLAENNDAEGINTLVPPVAQVVNSCLRGEQPAAGEDFARFVREVAEESLSRTHYRTVVAVLHLCGESEDTLLTELLQSSLTSPDAVLAPPSRPDDNQAAVDLLLQGMKIAAKQESVDGWLDRVMIAVFRAAADTEMTDYAWRAVGESVVPRAFEKKPTPERIETAKTMLKSVTADDCPDGHVRLHLLIIEHTEQSPGRFSSGLEYLAGVAPKCSQAGQTVSELVGVAEKMLKDVDRRVELLGRMAEVADGKSAEEPLVSACLKAMEKLPSEKQVAVREKLAGDGAAKVLCRELFARLLPWNREKSPAILGKWQSGPLSRGKIRDSFQGQVAQALLETPRTEDVLPLAEQVMPKKFRDGADVPGAARLCNAVVRSLPLAPLEQAWRQKLGAVKSSLDADSAQRLQLLEYMGSIDSTSRKPEWGLTSFQSQDDAWRVGVRALDQEQRKVVLLWWIDTFKGSGIASPQDAEALVVAMHAVDAASSDEIVGVVTRLLSGRDDITWVNAVMAFVRRAMGPNVDLQGYAALAGRVANSGNRKLSILLKEHLVKGCFPEDTKSQKRLRDICDVAGFAPRPVQSSPPASPKPGRRPAPSADNAGKDGRGLGRFVRSILGSKS